MCMSSIINLMQSMSWWVLIWFRRLSDIVEEDVAGYRFALGTMTLHHGYTTRQNEEHDKLSQCCKMHSVYVVHIYIFPTVVRHRQPAATGRYRCQLMTHRWPTPTNTIFDWSSTEGQIAARHDQLMEVFAAFLEISVYVAETSLPFDP